MRAHLASRMVGGGTGGTRGVGVARASPMSDAKMIVLPNGLVIKVSNL